MTINKSTLKAYLSLNLLILIFYISVGFPKDFLFLLTNFIILQLSILGLIYKPTQYYSLGKFFFMYTFFFFGIVPYLDMVNNKYYWGGGNIDIFYFITTNIIIVISMIAYVSAYLYSKKYINIEASLRKEHLNIQRVKKLRNIFSFILIFISLIASYFIFAKNGFNFTRMLVRGMSDDGIPIRSSLSQIEFLINNILITPLPVLALLLFGYISYKAHNFKTKVQLTFLMFLVLLFVAPTSIARFLAIALYLAMLLKFTSILEKKYLFQIGSIFGLLIIMPFLDKFRHFNLKTFNLKIDFNFLSAGHFDGYQNFVRLVSIDYISYGYQLLGPFAFFIPRSIWPNKPIGSGAELASLAHLNFSNISMPFVAEGYLNFSIFGSIGFMIILGYYSAKLDNYYWSLKQFTNNHSFFNIYYLLLGMSFFVFSGDLLSAFSYTVTILGSYMIMLHMVHKISMLKN